MDGEEAVFEFGTDLFTIGIFGEGETPLEGSIAAFGQMGAGTLGCRNFRPLSAQGEDVVADDHFDLVAVDAGKLDLNLIVFAGFRDIHGRNPTGVPVFDRAFTEEGVCKVEEAVGVDAVTAGWVGDIHGLIRIDFVLFLGRIGLLDRGEYFCDSCAKAFVAPNSVDSQRVA